MNNDITSVKQVVLGNFRVKKGYGVSIQAGSEALWHYRVIILSLYFPHGGR